MIDVLRDSSASADAERTALFRNFSGILTRAALLRKTTEQTTAVERVLGGIAKIDG